MIVRSQRMEQAARWVLLGSLAAVLHGCAGGGGGGDLSTAWRRVEAGAGTDSARLTAAEELWSAGLEGRESLDRVRVPLREIVWDRELSDGGRDRALALLLSDTRPEADASNQSLVRLMLPTEPSRTLVARMATTAGERGWVGVTDALVRRLSEDDAALPDRERAEAVALRALHGGAALEDVVFAAFLRPDAPEGMDSSLDWRSRVRAAAWEVLFRLDSSGALQRRLLASVPPAGVPDDSLALVAALRAAGEELGVNARTAMEFDWLRWLRDGSPRHVAWWDEARAALARVPEASRRGLTLRHAEPVRWAAANRPAWLTTDRAGLLAALEERLRGRERYSRSAELDVNRTRSKERLEDWQDRLSWGDLLAVLVVDEAVRLPALRASFAAYAVADRQDKKTEYGGLIEEGAARDGYRAVLYPPRTRDRLGDDTFVASDDMLRNGGTSLAQFHFHAASTRGSTFAGPSPGDMLYAKRSGRTGVVLTSLDGDSMNVDVYQPDGAIIDLGVIDVGPDPAAGDAS